MAEPTQDFSTSDAPSGGVALPSNVEAERALLGCLTLDASLIDEALSRMPSSAVQQAREHFVETDDARRRRRWRRDDEHEPLFFSPAHQLIFGAICDLHHHGAAVDLTTLADKLHKHSRLESVGGAPYLGGLEDDIVAVAQVGDYIDIVVEKWRLRCLARAAQMIAHEAIHATDSANDVVDAAEQRLFNLARDQHRQEFTLIRENLTEQAERIEARAKGVEDAAGLTTGFPQFDDLLSGLQPASLNILAARPSVGKTALALNIANHVTLNEKCAVGLFSLEMSRAALALRLLCTEAGVSSKSARKRPTLIDAEKCREALERVEHAPLYVDDASDLSIMEMRARARRLHAQCGGLGLLIVDYLQLMHGGSRRAENRQQEVSEISRGLKALARDLNIPVLALSQLSRQSEQRGTKAEHAKPRLSDLRESGALEQDADVVLFLHRKDKPKPGNDKQQSQPNETEPVEVSLIVGKHRNGAVGQVELMFVPHLTLFHERAYTSAP